MYCGYITKLSNIRTMPNADRLNLADCFGNQIIISKNHTEDELGVYFPVDGQLSEEFCKANDLVRRKNPDGTDGGGYLDPNKRNIRALKLRGERSDGLWLPISCFEYLDKHSFDFKEGEQITSIDGKEICKKYIPKHNASKQFNEKLKKNKKKYNFVFPEHIDTPQLAYSLSNFKKGDRITITEKLEGTSHRSALVPVKTTSWWRKLLRLPEKVEWKDVCGSRRVLIEENNPNDGFYGTSNFRLEVHKKIKPFLMKNMEVFAEIVGWPGEGMAPLMGEVDTTCLKNKEFTRDYGERMVFNYGCDEGKFDFYVYRICLLDDDGSVAVEFSTEQIQDYCEKCGWKYVPVLFKGFINGPEEVEKLAQKYCDGESTLAHHWREGCVIRRDNKASKFDVYKQKNFAFKMMRGLATENMKTEGLSEDIIEEMS